MSDHLLSTLPTHIIDKICYPSHIQPTTNTDQLSVYDKFCLCKMYHYWNDINTQFKHMISDFHFMKSKPNTYWWKYNDAPDWVFILRKNRWRNQSRYEKEITMIDIWKEKIVVMSLNHSPFIRMYFSSIFVSS